MTSHPLRVAVVSDAVPQRNGVGAYYHDLGQHLAERGMRFETFSPRLIEGAWTGGWSLPLPGDSTQRFVIPSFFRLRRELQAFAPDVVITPTPGFYGLAGVRYGRYLEARILVGFHTWYEKLAELYWNRLQGGLGKVCLTLTNRLLFRYADCVLANSDYMLAVARDLGARRTELMGTPVAYDFITTPVTKPADNIKSVLFAGRLATEKNIDAVLEAARTMPDVTFNIAGEGPERAKVQHAAAQLPNLHYLGWLDRSALLGVIDASDCLVLPSYVESFGTVALEAMARQRLTVVSRDCGITQWPELASSLFCISEWETLADTLYRIRNLSANERLAVARTAREAAVRLNDWNCDRWCRQLLPGKTEQVA